MALLVPALSGDPADPAKGGGERGQAPCSRVMLQPPPAWLSSALWVPSAGKILAVDTALNRVLLYAPSGHGTVVIDSQQGKLPALLATSEEGILLKMVGRDVVRLDESFRPAEEHSVLKDAVSDVGSVGSIYQWSGDHSILAYGSIRSPKLPDGYELGFLRIPVSPSGARTEMLMRYADGDYYRLGYQYLATLGTTGYFVRMAPQKAELFAVDADSTRPRLLPNAIPPAFRTPPKLEGSMTGPADAPKFYAQLEGFSIPTGLYAGADGLLYLLTRQPGVAAGVTDWSIYRIDPARDRVLNGVSLPTHAKHLSVVVAPSAFYFFERGELSPFGSQRIPSLVAIGAELIARGAPAGSTVCPQLVP
ncbi:MAG TPA: hypothetical protein VMW75_01540 [Thermoanaerobaculia bacterium]|nr:hypothetical protein [Thermoanaerobaculia bacterium]